MHLERRVIYCYTDYECDQIRQRRNIIMGVCISISFLSLIFGVYRYMNKKKKSQVNQSPAALNASAPANTNTQPKAEEHNPNWLPPYSNGNQGAQAIPNNLQNSSLTYYHAHPQDANNGQSGEYFAGGFAPPTNSQPNANQSYPPNFNMPMPNPTLNNQMGNLNNNGPLQYPAPTQVTLGQRQTDTLNNSATSNHDQNLNSQTATVSLANNSIAPLPGQRSE